MFYFALQDQSPISCLLERYEHLKLLLATADPQLPEYETN